MESGFWASLLKHSRYASRLWQPPIPRFILIDLISYMHLILCYIYNVRPCNNQMPDGSRLLDDGSKLSAKLTYWLSRQWTVTLWNG